MYDIDSMRNAAMQVLTALLLYCGYLYILKIRIGGHVEFRDVRAKITMSIVLFLIYSCGVFLLVEVAGALHLTYPFFVVVFFLSGLLAGYTVGRYCTVYIWESHKHFLIYTVIYSVALVYITMIAREPGQNNTIILSPFELFTNSDGLVFERLRHFGLNILMFMPLGFFLGGIHRRFASVGYAALVGVYFSTCVESAQLILRMGECDINDIFANALGAVLGGIISLFVLHGGLRRRRGYEIE